MVAEFQSDLVEGFGGFVFFYVFCEDVEEFFVAVVACVYEG